MNIAEIHQQYPNNELDALPGNEELKCELFASLLVATLKTLKS